MAGSGLRDKDCNDSIMQFERSNELSLVNEAKLSGISTKRFEARLRDRNEVARGRMLLALMCVNELSARDRYFNLCHLEGGRMFMLSKFEALSLR